MADEREMLLVQSKVREVIKAKGGAQGVRTSEEFLTGLNGVIHAAIEKAIERAKENGRATLRKHDL
ncbi:MAG TPA: hypothetical protein VN033_08560 [Vulgatibacter sp.]|nr:hypothetical protein [Vulgatibacter sp.]